MLFCGCSKDSQEVIQRVASPSSRAVALVERTRDAASLRYWNVSIASDWPWIWDSETVMRATTGCRGLTVRWISDAVLEIRLRQGNVLEFSKTAYVGFRRPFQRVEIRLVVSPEEQKTPTKTSENCLTMSS